MAVVQCRTFISKPPAPNEHTELPVSGVLWRGETKRVSAHLLVPLRIKVLQNLCKTTVLNVNQTQKTITALISSKMINSYNKDSTFITRLTYVLVKIEANLNSVVSFLRKNSICTPSMTNEILDIYIIFQKVWDKTFEQISSHTTVHTAETTRVSFNFRPTPIQAPLKQELLVGILAAGVTGLIGGSLITNIFGSDSSIQIEKLNNNLQQLNERVRVTNKRIDILSANVTTSLKSMQTILSNIHKLHLILETKENIMWNLQILLTAAENLLVFFKVSENTLTLLRSGIISPDLLSLSNLRGVIAEGRKQFNNLEFPIHKIDKSHIHDIISLIKVKNLGGNNYIIKLPLVEISGYRTYSLIPHPIRLQPGTLLIAEVNSVIMVSDTHYIITKANKIHSINDKQHVLKEILPMWDINHPTCEYSVIKKNVTDILMYCNFKRLGSSEAVHLTSVKTIRWYYSDRKTDITLKCPHETIRDRVTGLIQIPAKCELKTDMVKWPAHQSEDIDIDSLLDEKDKNNPLDITLLPVIEVNASNDLHNTIKEQIDKLPTNEPFTFSFSEDVTLQQVTSVSIVAYGTLTTLVFINTIVLILLIIYIMKVRRVEANKSYRPTVDKIKTKLRKKLPKSPRDSFRLSTRRKLRRTRNNINDPSHKGMDSIRSSLRSSFRSVSDRAKRLGRRDSSSDNNVVQTRVADRASNTNSSGLYPHSER